MIKGQRSKLELLDDYMDYNKKELNEILKEYQISSFSIVELANQYITGKITMDEICKTIKEHIREKIYKISRKEE